MGRLHRQMLEPEIRRWVEAGLLSAEQAGGILATYPVRHRQAALLAFSLIGSILILVGLILVLAANWDAIPGLAKLVLLLVLLAGATLVAVEGETRARFAPARESAWLFAVLLPLLALALISQHFHVEGHPFPLLLTWILLVTPTAVLSLSRAAWAVWLCGLPILLGAGVDHYDVREGSAYWLFCGLGLAMIGVSRVWLVWSFRAQARTGEFLGLLVGLLTLYIWGFQRYFLYMPWPVLFLLSLGLIGVGLRGEKVGLVNLGFVLIGLIILSYFFRLLGGMLGTGMGFILAGAVILLCVYFLHRLRARLLKTSRGSAAASAP